MQIQQKVINEAKKSSARVFVYPNSEMIPNSINDTMKAKIDEFYGTDAVVAADVVSFDSEI